MVSSIIRRTVIAATASSVLAFGVSALPASAATQQNGLVNVSLTNTNVQVPVAVAADICGVQANVIASNNFGGNAICNSTSHASATNGGGGGGNTNQQGLVNVSLTNTNIQVPIGIAATVCGVQANVIASGNTGGSALCSTVSRVTATA